MAGLFVLWLAQGCARNAQRKAGIRCRGKEERKTAEYRGEQNIRKRRDVDVRNGNEMLTEMDRKWAHGGLKKRLA